jgi:hypothetical protein
MRPPESLTYCRSCAIGAKRGIAVSIMSWNSDQIIDRICRYCSRISGPGH